MKKGLLFVLLAALLISGCNGKKTEKKIYNVGKEINQSETSKSETDGTSVTETTDKSESSDKRNMMIGFVNELSADIGMISIIDPITNEQVNIDGLADGKMIVVNSIIPKDTYKIEWAVYNKNGELYSSSETDITDAKESVYIIMCGNGSIEEVKTVFDKSEEEVKDVINNEFKH
ncbi:MAG: hypothetical protein Q4D29_02700 [Lachnospiraceae bacterium]|nr:hypothetical protein [Lachnospiraceae bacterium]